MFSMLGFLLFYVSGSAGILIFEEKEKLGSIFPDPVNLLVHLRVGAVRG
jgi:hypothetical protein